MTRLNVQVIPQHYLLHRWSEAATTTMPAGGQLLDFGLASTNTLKYNSLCRKYTWLASQACSNDVACKILDAAAKQLAPVIAAAKRGALTEKNAMHQQQAPQHQSQHPEQQTQQQQAQHIESENVPQQMGDNMLQNPKCVPKKGRPTEKSKRRKTLLEQREDENKKKTKKEDKKKEPKPKGKQAPKKKPNICSYCSSDGHDVHECKYMKAAMRLENCPYCKEVGHGVRECIYLKAAMSTDARVARETELRL